MFSNVLTVKRLQDKKSIAIFDVNKEAELFKEHFIEDPILPGAFSVVLCLELIVQSVSKEKHKQFFVAEIMKISFLKPIRPRDRLFVRIRDIKYFESDVTVAFNVSSAELDIFVDGLIKLRGFNETVSNCNRWYSRYRKRNYDLIG